MILGLKRKIENMDFSVYVDWIVDRQLDRTCISQTSADLLRKRMKSSKMLYAFSENSKKSVWMPWKLGFMDGSKPNRVAITQINEINDTAEIDFTGQEYLHLYPIVEKGYDCLLVNFSEKKPAVH